MRHWQAAEFLSLVLTPPTLILCAAVVLIFRRGCLLPLTRATQAPAQDWLILGIVASFTAALFDNLWWAGFWLADWLGNAQAAHWFQRNGALVNVIFRQGANILAAGCHVVAAMLFHAKLHPEESRCRRLLIWAMVLGASSTATAGALLFVRGL